MTKKEKRKVGRPSKFDQINLTQLKKLVVAGCTNSQIAEFFDVSVGTIWMMNKAHPEFFDGIKDWKKNATQRIARSLFERAHGYTIPEEVLYQYKGEIIRADVIKHYAPDVTAQIFWLKNRDPKNWRDRIDGALLDNSTHYHFTNLKGNKLIDEAAKEGIPLPSEITTRLSNQ